MTRNSREFSATKAPSKMPIPLYQTHGCLSELMGYYGNRYSTYRNRILWFLCACYDFNPPKFQNKCDGCLQTFLVCHALSCSNGDIFITRRNEIWDEIIHLSRQALPSYFLCIKPLIQLVCVIYEEEVYHVWRFSETWGDVSIWGI